MLDDKRIVSVVKKNPFITVVKIKNILQKVVVKVVVSVSPEEIQKVYHKKPQKQI